MNKILTQFFTFLCVYIFLILGLSMTSWIIWSRFLSEHLPRDIPFHLSFWSFFVLLFFCATYFYLFYKTFKPASKEITMTQIYPILQKLFEPMLLLHRYLIEKNFMKITVYNLLKFYIAFVNKKHYDHYDDYIYMVFFILPKIVFLISLVIDSFIFKQLYFIYSCTLILFVPLLLKYLLFCAPIVKEYYSNMFDKSFIVEITSEDIIYKPEDYDANGFLIIGKPYYHFDPSELEYDDDATLEIGVTKHKYLFAKKLIHYQDWAKRFKTASSLLYEYSILHLDERKDVLMLFEFKKPRISKRKANRLLCNLVEISVFEDYIEIHTKNIESLGIYTTKINLWIYALSFICWLYILTKSLHTLPENFIWLFLPKHENPFI